MAKSSTERSRDHYRRLGMQPRGPLKPCGTYAAYKRHLRSGERPCEPCRQAGADYNHELYRKRKEGSDG